MPCRIALALFMLGVLSCTDHGVESTESQETDIREMVFRHQFLHNGSGKDTSAHFYFLAFAVMDSAHRVVVQSDPDAEFMDRFAAHQPPVYVFSQCSIAYGGPVYDKLTGQEGLIFRVGQIRWLSSDDVEVEGGYWAGGRNAEGDLFYLRRTDIGWLVYEVKMKWVA